MNWNNKQTPLQRPPTQPRMMNLSRRRHTLHAAAPSTATISTSTSGSSMTTIPSRLVDSSSEDEYGYERRDSILGYNNYNRDNNNPDHRHHLPPPPLPPSPVAVDPMSPERLARKQRIRPASRRGGACHSDLLKSAVLATLESYESEEDLHSCTTSTATTGNSSASTASAAATSSSVVTPNSRRHTMAEVDLASMASMNTSNLMMMDDNSRSSRKRARQGDLDSSYGGGGGVDDCLLGAMDFCTISTRGQHQPQSNSLSDTSSTTRAIYPAVAAPRITVPVRHVARRTSKELACGIVTSPRTNGDPCHDGIGMTD